MDQFEKFNQFSALHVKGVPLILYNIWDAGSAQAVAKAGAKALATGSWSVAAAQGYDDGQALPLEALVRTASQIVQASDLPVSVDFEGGYAEAPEALAETILPLLEAGVIGINFEDRIVGGSGLHGVAAQAARIRALRNAADTAQVPLFINARTDLFLGSDVAAHSDFVAEAQERAAAYAGAGANGLFVPGLQDLALIAEMAETQPLPLNVMRLGQEPVAEYAKAGVSRISHGPAPYRAAMAKLKDAAAVLYL